MENDFDILFNRIIEDVAKGNTIYESCLKFNINRKTFYAKMSLEQKKELLVTKTMNAKSRKWFIGDLNSGIELSKD